MKKTGAGRQWNIKVHKRKGEGEGDGGGREEWVKGEGRKMTTALNRQGVRPLPVRDKAVFLSSSVVRDMHPCGIAFRPICAYSIIHRVTKKKMS